MTACRAVLRGFDSLPRHLTIWSSRYSGDLLHLTAEELRKHYRFYYRVTKPLLKIKGQIDDIVDADIFEREDEMIVGKESIFQDYVQAGLSLSKNS